MVQAQQGQPTGTLQNTTPVREKEGEGACAIRGESRGEKRACWGQRACVTFYCEIQVTGPK